MTHTTRKVHIPSDIYVAISVPRDRADWGWANVEGPYTYQRLCLVEPSGAVLAWDSVSETYSRHHELSAAEEAEARRLAAHKMTSLGS